MLFELLLSFKGLLAGLALEFLDNDLLLARFFFKPAVLFGELLAILAQSFGLKLPLLLAFLFNFTLAGLLEGNVGLLELLEPRVL